MSEDFDIELRLLSQPRYLCVARAAVGAAVEKLGYSDGLCGQIMLAVDEAVANVIRHGYDGRADQPIWVRFRPTGLPDEASPAGFVIVIDDLAKQVDPALIKSRDLEDVRPGGIGVHIIQKIMDHVSYEPRPEGGMRLTMTKNPPAPQRDSTSSER